MGLEVKTHTRTTQYDMSPPKLQTTGGKDPYKNNTI
jgi:hypothetical protein